MAKNSKKPIETTLISPVPDEVIESIALNVAIKGSINAINNDTMASNNIMLFILYKVSLLIFENICLYNENKNITEDRRNIVTHIKCNVLVIFTTCNIIFTPFF